MNLISEIENLKSQIALLQKQIQKIQVSNSDDNANSITPYSKVGGSKDPSASYTVDISTGLGGTFGNTILWNDAELKIPPYGINPGIPTKGYHKHTHSEFSGGGLIINYLMLIEYDTDFDTDPEHSPHSQQFWNQPPPIKKDANGIEQKGTLFGKKDDPNIVWDKINLCWRFYAVYADDEPVPIP